MPNSTPNHWRPRVPLQTQRAIEAIAKRRGVTPSDVLRQVLARGLLSVSGYPVLPAPPPSAPRADAA